MKKYGTLAYDATMGRWRLKLVPHVTLRVKRILPRVNVHTSGALHVADTLEVAHDLDWIMGRWPLDVDDASAAVLERRLGAFRARERTVESIMGGYVEPFSREPARPPKPHQVQAARLVHATGRLLLCDGLGAGKTTTGIMTLLGDSALPGVVVVPTHLAKQWVRETGVVAPWLRTHIVATKKVYDPSDLGGAPDVLIITYSKLADWAHHLAGQVQTVIFDEAQEVRRPATQKREAAALIAAAARYRLMLTATPVFNYGDDLFWLCDIIAPGELGDPDEFSREWCTRNAKDKKVVKDPAALGTHLRDSALMLVRTAEEVGMSADEPALNVPHPIDIDDERYDRMTSSAVALAEMLLSGSGSQEDRWRAAADIDWRLRHATGVAKAPYVAQFVEMLLGPPGEPDQGTPVVLFGWHKDVYDVWRKKLGAYAPAFVTGDESPRQKEEAVRRFTSGETNLIVLSLRAGAGIDGLQHRSNVCVFGELDWSPGQHKQCVGRLERFGQARQVVAYYLTAESGSDPVIAETLDLKRQQADPVIDPDAPLLAPVVETDQIRSLAARFLEGRGLPVPVPAARDGAGDEQDDRDDEEPLQALDEEPDAADEQGEDEQEQDERHGDLRVARLPLYAGERGGR